MIKAALFSLALSVSVAVLFLQDNKAAIKGLVTKASRFITTDHAAGLLLAAGLFVGLFYLYPESWPLGGLIQAFYANASAEFISIAITVFVIDRLNRRRQDEQLKAQLIRDLGSRSGDFALRAVSELREHGWLDEGLSYANLRYASLSRANLGETKLSKVKLWGANLSHANLRRADLYRVNLRGADLIGADLSETILSRADLSGNLLYKANMYKAILYKSNLGKANLSHTNLRDANLGGADLRDAEYNNTTVWPDDFDPKAAGAINVGEESKQEQEQ